MRQYQVPQFIDIEDKIIGPLTLRQFLYLATAGAIGLISYYILNFFVFILITAPVAMLALALAFFKVNGVPFPKVMSNMIAYITKPHLYIWKQRPPEKKKSTLLAPTAINIPKVPTLTESKLQDLAWSLDIKEQVEN